MSDKPSHWDWIAEVRAIRDGRAEPPADDSPSAQLAAELGADTGDDPFNDRCEEATGWCWEIMKSEGRERLLQAYHGSGSDWLHNRLRGAVDDHVFWSGAPLPPLVFSAGVIEAAQSGVRSIGGLDLRDPTFNLGGVLYGVIAALPAALAVFEPGNDTFTPVTMYGYLKNDHKRWAKTCDWHLKNCENRRRFVLAFPIGNWIVFYATCNSCAGELGHRIGFDARDMTPRATQGN